MQLVAEQLPQLRDPADRLGHELLARVSGVDAHAEDEVHFVRRPSCVSRARLGVEGQPDSELQLTRPAIDRRQVLAGLEMDGDAVAARFGHRLEVLLRMLDHEMAVESGA